MSRYRLEMRRRCLLVLLATAVAGFVSFTSSTAGAAIEKRRVEASAQASAVFLDLARQDDSLPRGPVKHAPRPHRRFGNATTASPAPEEGAVDAPFPQSTLLTPGSVAGFVAVLDNDSTDPPDTNGAVGPAHVMTTLNSQVRIQDRVGANLGTVSIETFVASVAPGEFLSDPHVTFDPYGGRWIFTVAIFPPGAGGSLVVAVSTTVDPTATWNFFRFDDPDQTLYIDYPSLGFNKDWIVIDTDMFSADGTSITEHVWVFDKTKLYAGVAAAPTVFTGIQDSTVVPATTYDPALDFVYLVSAYNGAAKQLRLYAVGSSAGTPTFTAGGAIIGTSAWDDYAQSQGNGGWAKQKGTTATLDPGDSRIINATFRNGSLWASHTVFLPRGQAAQHAAGQWWEIRPPADISADITPRQVGRIEDATGVQSYCYTSIAVNEAGDVLLGGTRFAADRYPAVFGAFHGAGDAPGVTRAPRIYKEGESKVAKGGGDFRWGDYSATVPDPDGLTFWTLQEYGSTPVGDDRWGTWWAHVDPSKNFSAPGKKHRGPLGCSCDLAEGGEVSLGGACAACVLALATVLRRRRKEPGD